MTAPPPLRRADTTEIDSVLGRLDETTEWSLRNHSRLGYFAVVYRRMTQGIKNAMLRGDFDDAERMSRFDGVFADRYFSAFEAHQSGRRVPGPWALAFEQARRWRPMALQHLLLGMNAHIGFDLGLALLDLAEDPPFAELRPDYVRINAIIAALLDRVQESLNRVSPILPWLDRLGGVSDEAVVNFSVETAREGAWQFARRLAGAPHDQRAAIIAERDADVTRFGRCLARPGLPLRLLVDGARIFESSSVVPVIRSLEADI